MNMLAENETLEPGAVSTTARTALLGLMLATLVLLFWATFESMVAIWWRSETFAHGFFAWPVSVYLIWRKRGELGRLPFSTDFRAVLPLGMLGFAWLLADLTDVLVVEQLAVVAMVPTLVWLTLGWRAIRVLAFPLAFLGFAVPMGEQLVYPLMKFTAAFTVTMLRLSGIPVYWEGTFFSIPSGDWSVVEACSGIRYLIASVFLGCLYAYLSYRAFWRRALFVALAALVPIIANGLRAYIIVMIGHLSNMKLAVGVDHLIYGWLFFGVVMLLLFMAGALWREPAGGADDGVARSSERESAPVESVFKLSVVVVIGLLSLIIWPVWAGYLDQPAGERAAMSPRSPTGFGSWEPVASKLTNWAPQYRGYAQSLRQGYADGDDRVDLYLAYYEAGEGELVSSQNVMAAQNDPVWTMPHEVSRGVILKGGKHGLIESQLRTSGQSLLVWHWYWINGYHVANDYSAKLREAFVRLSGERRREAGIVVFTNWDQGPDEARERLQRFLEAMLPSIEASLTETFDHGQRQAHKEERRGG